MKDMPNILVCTNIHMYIFIPNTNNNKLGIRTNSEVSIFYLSKKDDAEI